MDSKRLRMVLIGMLIISALLFLGVYVIGSSVLQNKSKRVVDLKLKSHTTEAQLTNLAQAKQEVEKYGYFKQVAKTVIPNDKDQAQAVLDIFQLANESGLSLQSVTFPASTLGVRSATPTTNDAQGTPAQTVLSQAKAVDGIAGLYSIELTISPSTDMQLPPDKKATYPKLLDFLNRIERNRRTAQVTQVNIQPVGTDAGESQFINFNLTINIFIKP